MKNMQLLVSASNDVLDLKATDRLPSQLNDVELSVRMSVELSVELAVELAVGLQVASQLKVVELSVRQLQQRVLTVFKIIQNLKTNRFDINLTNILMNLHL